MFPLRGNFPLAREEIPAFAGMEEVGGNGKRGAGMEEGGRGEVGLSASVFGNGGLYLAMLASILVMLASVLAINSRKTISVFT